MMICPLVVLVQRMGRGGPGVVMMAPGGFPYFLSKSQAPAVIVDRPPMQKDFQQAPNSTCLYLLVRYARRWL